MPASWIPPRLLPGGTRTTRSAYPLFPRAVLGPQRRRQQLRVITRMLGEDAARGVLDHVAPVGENQETVERAMRAVRAGERALR